MIFSLPQIQKFRKQNYPLNIAFVDLTETFDMVDREGLCNVIQNTDCLPRLLSLVRSLHDNMGARTSYEVSCQLQLGRKMVESKTVFCLKLFQESSLSFSIMHSVMMEKNVITDGVFLAHMHRWKIVLLCEMTCQNQTSAHPGALIAVYRCCCFISHSETSLQSLMDPVLLLVRPFHWLSATR